MRDSNGEYEFPMTLGHQVSLKHLKVYQLTVVIWIHIVAEKSFNKTK